MTIMKAKEYTAPRIELIQLDTEASVMIGSFSTSGYGDGSMFPSSSRRSSQSSSMAPIEDIESMIEDILTVKK